MQIVDKLFDFTYCRAGDNFENIIHYKPRDRTVLTVATFFDNFLLSTWG